MSYIRFIWFKVKTSDGKEIPLRWALNVSPIPGRITLEEYITSQSMTLISGPFKTRKAAE